MVKKAYAFMTTETTKIELHRLQEYLMQIPFFERLSMMCVVFFIVVLAAILIVYAILDPILLPKEAISFKKNLKWASTIAALLTICIFILVSISHLFPTL